jgi:transposase
MMLQIPRLPLSGNFPYFTRNRLFDNPSCRDKKILARAAPASLALAKIFFGRAIFFSPTNISQRSCLLCVEEFMNHNLSDASLESLDVGGVPVVQHFLNRLQLLPLLHRHLLPTTRRPELVPSALTLTVLITNLLLARTPLYDLANWLANYVPEHLGLTPEQLPFFQDDRFGHALDQLYRTDRAALLFALVRNAVRAFQIDLKQFHNDTTTVTLSGDYDKQLPTQAPTRPPRITFGFNKDHRPDLKQLLYSVTISNDGAVPVHAEIYDGNTSDTQVHVEAWNFLRELTGRVDFLYVADSKLCTHDNTTYIAGEGGRFLSVLPRTRKEAGWFEEQLQHQDMPWLEVRRTANPRRRRGPDHVYHGVESSQLTREGYRVLWYRSSQKQAEDARRRLERSTRARERLSRLRPRGRSGRWRKAAALLEAAQRVLAGYRVGAWLTVSVVERIEVTQRQRERGRPGPQTTYEPCAEKYYELVVEENRAALTAAAKGDGLFPLVTNDKAMSLAEALAKYKYQPFVEKRHEQLKTVFEVAPVWLKNPKRVAALLWLYYVVELVQALVERELRQQMRAAGVAELPLYPEGRGCASPTTELVFRSLARIRRHRLLNAKGEVVRTFHDAVSEVGVEVLGFLGVDRGVYGLA